MQKMIPTLYILVRTSFGPFDVVIDTPICVSSNKEKLQEEADKRSAALDNADIAKEIVYVIMPEPIYNLDS
jgi:hypothetical protein